MPDNPLIMAAGAASRRALRPPTAPVEEQSLAGRVAQSVLSPIGMIGNVLDLPGSGVRDVLTGNNPFDQWLTPLSADNRATGRDVNQHFGLSGPNDPNKWEWGDVGGFLTEVATDPLSWISGGTGAIGKGAGQAAYRAGLANGLTRTQRATSTAVSLLDDYGKRFGTEALNRKAAELVTAANKLGVSQADLMSKPVGSWMKVHGPFGIPIIPEIPINNAWAAGKLDAAGKALADSALGRGTKMLFGSKYKGALKATDQDLQKTISDFEEQFKPEFYKHGSLAAQEIGGLREKFKQDAAPLFSGTGPLAGRNPDDVFGEVFRQTAERAGPSLDFRGELQNAMARQGVATPLPQDLVDAFHKTLTSDYTGRSGLWQGVLNKGIKGKPVVSSNGTLQYPRRVSQDYLDFKGEKRSSPGFLHAESQTRAREPWLRDLPTDVADKIVADPKYFQPKNTAKNQPGGADNIEQDFVAYLGYKGKLGKRVTSTEHAVKIKEKLQAYHKEQMAKKAADPNHVPRLFEAANPEETARGYHPGVGSVDTKASAIHDYIARNAAAAPTGTPVGEAYKQIGMLRIQALNHLAKKLGKPVDDVAKLKLSPEALQSVMDLKEGKFKTVDLGEVGKAIDKYVLNPAKTNWTLPFPPFHAQNRLGGEFLNIAAGPHQNPLEALQYAGRTAKKSMLEGWDGTGGRFRTEADPNMLDMIAHDTIGDQKRAFQDVPLAPNSMTRNPLDLKDSWKQAGEQVKDAPWVTDQVPYLGQAVNFGRQAHGAWLDTGSKVAGLTEYHNRANLFEHLVEKGWSPSQAAKEVEKRQFDYSKATPFEKDVLKRLFPFYGFASNITKAIGTNLMEHPGGAVAQTMRLQNAGRDKEDILPAHIADTAAVNMGQSPDGSQNYLTGFGIPTEAAAPYLAAPLAPISALTGGPSAWQNAARTGAAALNPLVKYPLEAGSGVTFFQRGADGGGRPLTELDPNIGRLLSSAEQDITGKTDGPWNWMAGHHGATRKAEHLISNTPASRYIAMLRGTLDPRKRDNPLSIASNLLTPIDWTQVSPQQQERMQQAASNALADQLGAKTWKNRYFSAEQIAATEKINPEAAATMRKLNAMWGQAKKNAAKYRAEKKKPASPKKDERAANELLRMAGL